MKTPGQTDGQRESIPKDAVADAISMLKHRNSVSIVLLPSIGASAAAKQRPVPIMEIADEEPRSGESTSRGLPARVQTVKVIQKQQTRLTPNLSAEKQTQPEGPDPNAKKPRIHNLQRPPISRAPAHQSLSDRKSNQAVSRPAGMDMPQMLKKLSQQNDVRVVTIDGNESKEEKNRPRKAPIIVHKVPATVNKVLCTPKTSVIVPNAQTQIIDTGAVGSQKQYKLRQRRHPSKRWPWKTLQQRRALTITLPDAAAVVQSRIIYVLTEVAKSFRCSVHSGIVNIIEPHVEPKSRSRPGMVFLPVDNMLTSRAPGTGWSRATQRNAASAQSALHIKASEPSPSVDEDVTLYPEVILKEGNNETDVVLV